MLFKVSGEERGGEEEGGKKVLQSWTILLSIGVENTPLNWSEYTLKLVERTLNMCLIYTWKMYFIILFISQ